MKVVIEVHYSDYYLYLDFAFLVLELRFSSEWVCMPDELDPPIHQHRVRSCGVIDNVRYHITMGRLAI